MFTDTSFLATNLFWLSLSLIGYSIIRFFSTAAITPHSIRQSFSVLLKQHIFILFFAATVMAFGLLAPLVFMLYIVKAPVIVLAAVYLLLLTLSVLYVAYRCYRSLLLTSRKDPLQLAGQPNLVKYISALLILAVFIDFYVAMLLDAHAVSGSDTYYHITRIVTMLSEGVLTIDSGFFVGVPDASYQANLIYALYTIPAKLFALSPLEIWSHSFGFFRLMQWMAIFTVSYVVFGQWVKAKLAVLWASLATLLAVPLFSHFFYIATYPNQVVIAWIMAFITLLLIYVHQSKFVYLGALCVVAFLITTTHPTYALMTAMLTIYWYLLYGILYRQRSLKVFIKRAWPVALLTVILMISPIISRSIPSHITPEQQTITASSTVDLPLGMSMLSPQTLLPENKLQLMILLLSIAGFAYAVILWRRKTGKEMSVLCALVTFPIVILYLPPVFTVLQILLPVWVIQRSASMDIFQFILPFLGAAAATVVMVSVGKTVIPRKYGPRKGGDLIILSILVLVLSCAAGFSSYKQLAASKEGNPEAYEYAEVLRDGIVSKRLKLEGATVLADDRVSYTLPAIVGVNVISLEIGHSTTAADTKHRVQCKSELFKNFRYSDMAFTGVDYIMISKFDNQIDYIRRLIATKPYIQSIATVADLTIYKFNQQQVPIDNGLAKEEISYACATYRAVENYK